MLPNRQLPFVKQIGTTPRIVGVEACQHRHRLPTKFYVNVLEIVPAIQQFDPRLIALDANTLFQLGTVSHRDAGFSSMGDILPSERKLHTVCKYQAQHFPSLALGECV